MMTKQKNIIRVILANSQFLNGIEGIRLEVFYKKSALKKFVKFTRLLPESLFQYRCRLDTDYKHFKNT